MPHVVHAMRHDHEWSQMLISDWHAWETTKETASKIYRTDVGHPKLLILHFTKPLFFAAWRPSEEIHHLWFVQCGDGKDNPGDLIFQLLDTRISPSEFAASFPATMPMLPAMIRQEEQPRGSTGSFSLLPPRLSSPTGSHCSFQATTPPLSARASPSGYSHAEILYKSV